uniref:Uncharacterized protein n=1 Tax=Megaselia scalaris TaxID=36166 RepID=T1GRN4_MEGSC
MPAQKVFSSNPIGDRRPGPPKHRWLKLVEDDVNDEPSGKIRLVDKVSLGASILSFSNWVCLATLHRPPSS